MASITSGSFVEKAIPRLEEALTHSGVKFARDEQALRLRECGFHMSGTGILVQPAHQVAPQLEISPAEIAQQIIKDAAQERLNDLRGSVTVARAIVGFGTYGAGCTAGFSGFLLAASEVGTPGGLWVILGGLVGAVVGGIAAKFYGDYRKGQLKVPAFEYLAEQLATPGSAAKVSVPFSISKIAAQRLTELTSRVRSPRMELAF